MFDDNDDEDDEVDDDDDDDDDDNVPARTQREVCAIHFKFEFAFAELPLKAITTPALNSARAITQPDKYEQALI